MADLSEQRRRLGELKAKADGTAAAARAASAEAEAARKEYESAEAAVRQARSDAFVAHLTPELIDLLAPEHAPPSCSDVVRSGADGRCARCVLLDAHMDGFWSSAIGFEFGVRSLRD